MRDHQKRLFFLCAQGSVRSLLAASLLSARVRGPWDIWSTPTSGDMRELKLAWQVLDELGIPLLTSSQTTAPSFGLTWDEGIILCSGLAAT